MEHAKATFTSELACVDRLVSAANSSNKIIWPVHSQLLRTCYSQQTVKMNNLVSILSGYVFFSQNFFTSRIHGTIQMRFEYFTFIQFSTFFSRLNMLIVVLKLVPRHQLDDETSKKCSFKKRLINLLLNKKSQGIFVRYYGS